MLPLVYTVNIPNFDMIAFQENDTLEDIELPLFGLDIIMDATNNFSSLNKIGEGGFGPVYKVLVNK